MNRRGFFHCQYTKQRTDQNTKIRNIKYNILQPLPLYAEAKIIYHIFTFQSIVGITVRASQQKSQAGAQQRSSLTAQARQKEYRAKNCHSQRNRGNQRLPAASHV